MGGLIDIDLRSGLVICTLLALLNGLVLGLLRGDLAREQQPAAWNWAQGSLLLALGFALMAAQGFALPLATVALAHFSLTLGVTSYWRALRRWSRRPEHWTLALPPAFVLVTAIWFTLGEPSGTGRVVASSWAMSVACVGAAVALRNRRGADASGSRRLLLGLFALTAVFLAWRGLHYWWRAFEGLAIDEGDPAQTLSLLVAAAVPTVGTLGLLLLCNERTGRQLERAAATDYLTGTLNRSSLAAAGERAVVNSRRGSITGCAVLMVDLDHFKRVNDRFGHEVGDRLLQHAALRMNDGARQNDLLGRHGGEEFVMLLEGVDRSTASAAAERLRRGVERNPMRHDGESIPITVSVGVALLDATDRDFDDLLRRAERALLAAKGDGRNRVAMAEAN